MTGLQLLNDYDSTDEETDDYNGTNLIKTKLRLPLPDLPSNKYSKSITREKIDDGDAHEGRQRSFAHTPGNWATYVYITVDSSEELEEFVRAISHSCNLQLVKDIHISLTKTVVLKHHWIDDFMKSIRMSLETMPNFDICLQGLKVFTNDEKTRTFLALEVQGGDGFLHDLVHKLDSCLNEYHLPPFYSNPSFHCSIAWCLGDETVKLNKYLQCMSVELKSQSFFQNVSHCECACGNKRFNFTLSDR